MNFNAVQFSISRHLRYAVMCCILLSPSLIIAQNNNTKPDSTKNKKLNEVKVEAKRPAYINYPAPVQLVTKVDFVKYSAYNVADIIRSFAGVTLLDYGGIGGLKTVSVRGLGADNTAVLYNGIILNDAENGQIDLSKFNLNNISRIMLYNPQPDDIVQTARAFSAASVLSIQTIQPQLKPDKPYQVLLGYKGGSFGLVNPYVQYQQRINKQWSFILDGQLENANGRYKYKETRDASDTLAVRRNSDITSQQMDGGLYWARNDSNKFNLQFDFYRSHRGLPTSVILYANTKDKFLYNQDQFIQAGYHHVAKNSFELLLNTRATVSYSKYIDSGLVKSTGVDIEHYKQREIYQSVAVAYKILPFWKLSYATDADLSSMATDAYQYQFPTRLSLFNVLATDVVAGRWRLQGNLLHTFISDYVQRGTAGTSKSDLTPTAIVSFKPFTDTLFTLRAFYKGIFRNPTFAEQYYYNIVPRQLKPEYASQYDVGAVYMKNFNGIFNYIALSADAFYNHVRDKIIYIPTRNPATPSVVNLGVVDVQGINANLKSEFDVAYRWKGSFSASYTYQLAQDVTNPSNSFYLDQIPYTPKNILAYNIGMTHKGLGLYYNQVLSASRFQASNSTAENFMPGYGISDASLVYHFILKTKPVSLSTEVNNLFNKRYEVVAGFPMPGASFRFTMQITI